MRVLHFSIIAVLIAVMLVGCDTAGRGKPQGITVAAPRFLKGILERAEKQFEEENRIPVEIDYFIPDSMITLSLDANRVDLFLAANPRSFRAIDDDTSLIAGQYACPFFLSMTLAGRAGGPRADDLDDLRKTEFKRVVIVDSAAGYEGFLAKEILKKRRLYDRLKSKLIPARSAEQLISYMNTGEADAAIAFESTFHDRPGFVMMRRLDNLVGERLIICGAVTAHSRNASSAQAFLDLLDSRLCPMYDIRGVYRTAD